MSSGEEEEEEEEEEQTETCWNSFWGGGGGAGAEEGGGAAGVGVGIGATVAEDFLRMVTPTEPLLAILAYPTNIGATRSRISGCTTMAVISDGVGLPLIDGFSFFLTIPNTCFWRWDNPSP